MAKTTSKNPQVGKITDEEERKKALSNTLGAIEKQFGKGAIMKLGEKTAMNVQTIPSGCLELDAVPAGRPEVQCEAGRVSLKYSAVECEERGTIPIAVSLSAELCGDEIHWGIALENRSQEQVVREVHYPILSIRDPEPPMAAITSELPCN